jgi:hypothetical protein
MTATTNKGQIEPLPGERTEFINVEHLKGEMKKSEEKLKILYDELKREQGNLSDINKNELLSNGHQWQVRNKEDLIKQVMIEINKLELKLKGAHEYLSEANQNGGRVFRKYRKSTSEGIGRWYVDGFGMQTMTRALRAAAANGWYVDLDMPMCFQMLIRETLRIKEGFDKHKLQAEFPKLMAYIADKDGTRKSISDHYGCSTKAAKELLLRLTHGGKERAWRLEFRHEMHPNKQNVEPMGFVQDYIKEVDSVIDIFNKHYPKCVQLAKRVRDEGSRRGKKRGRDLRVSAFAYALQDIEADILNHMVSFFEVKLKRKVDVLIHDGFMVRTMDDADVTDENLRDCIAYVKDKTGYNVGLEQKPM